MLSVPLVPVVLKKTIVLCLNESRPLIVFLRRIKFCFIRSVIISAKSYFVTLEAVVLVMKSNIESTPGRLWLMPFE